MTFPIAIKYYKSIIRLNVERIHLDERKEQYRIIAKNAVIEIEFNRPYYRNKGLKHRSDWNQTIGQTVSERLLNLIAEAITEHVEKKGKQK